MTHRSIVLVSLTFVAALALAPLSAHAAGVPCAALTHAAIANTTITSATLVAAAGTAPEHCLVVGPADTEIGFELRMPTTTATPPWNGKFYHTPGGGFAGSIPRSPPPLAPVPAAPPPSPRHLAAGALAASPS